MAVIKIGSVTSMADPETLDITPDDRQELVKCVNGVFAVDAGYFKEGEIVAVTAVFSPSAWATLKANWIARIRVDVVDHNGEFYPSMRIVVKKYGYIKRHKFYQVTLELWRV